MQLDLTDEEMLALLNLLTETIETHVGVLSRLLGYDGATLRELRQTKVIA
jgi:hypothetical protein